MGRLKMIAAGLAASMLLAGQAFAQDFGRVPADYQEAAVDYLESRLEDPRGARVNYIGEPYRVYADIGSYEDLPAWAVDVDIRFRMAGGRRGAGGYTVIFVDGDPVALEDDVYQLTRL